MTSYFYHLYFIKDGATSLQDLAFNAVSSFENLEAVWIEGENALEKFKDSTPKNSCFVFGKFSGPIYEHFKVLGSSVFGPQVLLDYLREERPLPNVSHPLFSTALRNANVTVTSVTGSQRENLFASIEMLHGTAFRNLTDEVNIIVTPKVGSKKYIVGASRGVRIVKPEWIDEAWRLSETIDPIDMLQHSMLDKFKLPIFAQLVICVSGLTMEERREVAKIVATNGGHYSGEMKIGATTHLLVKRPGGVKYNFAKKWKIRIVSVRWLTDSVNRGYALDECEYFIKEGDEHQNWQFSTPVSSFCANDPCVLGDISAITDSNQGKVDETIFSCTKDIANCCDSKSPPKYSFLNGCVIFLYGCSPAESTRFANIIKIGGGVLCADASDKVTESVTHVVLSADTKTIPFSDLESNVLYVTCDWLEQCHLRRTRLSEEDFKPHFLNKAGSSEQCVNSDDKQTDFPVDTEEIQLINQYFRDGGLTEMDDFPSVDINPDNLTVQAESEKQKCSPRAD